MVGACETRAEPSDSLTELKRGTGQAPRKLVNANEPGKNNNLNVGPKRDKIAKDIINEVTGPAEAQSVSKKIKLTWFASVHECSLRVDLLLREVRELLKLALITPIRGSIRMRSSGQIGTESLGVRHCDCSSDALRRRRISFHESPTGTYPISWATNSEREEALTGDGGDHALRPAPAARTTTTATIAVAAAVTAPRTTQITSAPVAAVW
ncbi:PREDICTED: uncharacterized protein LOC105146411 [Acromyrmex echinatior]|uniref:uncharacterized protein LOC105146411 n=1 Tax=Acromyrmex echinatior TaxID=103372 RepID=UPI000580F311|nr:PREDICTED: uncharacterized protein LOC105146411 [Acromyrmex echinatior]